jgi:type I restriction enzyme S subunit
MSDWKKVMLGDIAQIIGGGTPSTKVEEYWNGEISWLTPRDLTGYTNKFISKGERNITEDGLKNSSARMMPKGTVLMTSRAPIGYIAIAEKELCTNQGFKSFIVDEDIIDNEFLYYQLKANVERIKSLGSGSTFAEVSGSVLKGIEIEIPVLPTQKEIAQILSSLDDKIELNLQMNQTLEAMAQAIFKEWFVDFNFPGFDGELVDGLPKGWRNAALGDVTTLIAGGDKPNDFSEQPNEHNGVPIYSNGISNEGLYGYTKKPRIIEESVTVSARGTIGFVCLRLRPYFPIVRLISVIPKSEILTAKYLYYWLINQNISGTGTTQQQLTVPDFGRFNILIPDIHVVAEFTTIVDAFYQKIDENKTQIKSLTQTRDTLLLKLMSGQLEVKK